MIVAGAIQQGADCPVPLAEEGRTHSSEEAAKGVMGEDGSGLAGRGLEGHSQEDAPGRCKRVLGLAGAG